MKNLVVSLYLASALWIVRFAIDELDPVFFGFSLEFFGDELFAIVDIDLFGFTTFLQRPL